MHCEQFIKIRASREAPAYMYTYALVYMYTVHNIVVHIAFPCTVNLSLQPYYVLCMCYHAPRMCWLIGWISSIPRAGYHGNRYWGTRLAAKCQL